VLPFHKGGVESNFCSTLLFGVCQGVNGYGSSHPHRGGHAMGRTVLLVVTTLTVILNGVGQAKAENILINGDFESEPSFGSGGWAVFTGNQIPGWTIVPAHAVTVHLSGSSNPTISGNYTVNTDGEGYNGHDGDFFQDFNTMASVRYALDFDWESWWNTSAANLVITITDNVTNGILFNGTYGYDGELALHHVSENFTGTGNSLRLEIQESPEDGVNDNKYLVDNFNVEAVPEPASLTMLCISAVVVGGCTHRKRKWKA
jgi:hypothetical protein